MALKMCIVSVSDVWGYPNKFICTVLGVLMIGDLQI
jgi:hypothetical protein